MNTPERLEHMDEAINHLQEAADLLKEIGEANKADAVTDIAEQVYIRFEQDKAAQAAEYAEMMRELTREMELERGCR